MNGNKEVTPANSSFEAREAKRAARARQALNLSRFLSTLAPCPLFPRSQLSPEVLEVRSLF